MDSENNLGKLEQESVNKNENKINKKQLIGNLLMMVAIMIFIGIFSKFFGSSNTLVGVTILTAALMFTSMDVSLKFKDAIASIILVFTLMGVTSYVGMLNAFIGIPLNFISVFIIIYTFSNKLESRAYLPFMLCYVFMQGTPIKEINEFFIRIAALFIGSIIVAIVYYFTHKKAKDDDNRSIKEMFSTAFDIKSIQANFALRMAIGITIAMFVGTYFGFEKGMWISTTVLSLTQPYYEQTKEKIPQRIFGTVVGAIAFIIIFYYIVPKSLDSMAVLVISYIYMFVKPYKYQMIFTTLNALSAAMILFNFTVSVPMRIVFMLVGIVIAIIVNKSMMHVEEKIDEKENSL
ncbi:FUSC family protein [Clostridium sp. Ade.TY]|uniref:FUSC family protein n=1 Tax=Clostridium sp. Ade.TY TaxID=1391647 RepID=UPI0003F54D1C|nr:FUSC family protein [Clostridium sp. Ade.TY]